MIHPLDFIVHERDDLLVWSDLWLDHGRERESNACKTLYDMDRWPRRYGYGYMWTLRSQNELNRFRHVASRKESLSLAFYPLVYMGPGDSRRSYPTITLAFLDIILHLTSVETKT